MHFLDLLCRYMRLTALISVGCVFSKPLDDVIDTICKRGKMPTDAEIVKTYTARDALNSAQEWDVREALIVLAEYAVKDMTRQSREEFIDWTNIRRLAVSSIADVVSKYSAPVYFLETRRLTGRVSVCVSQLKSSPMWNLDLIVPELVASNKDLAGIVFRHKAVRKAIAQSVDLRSVRLAGGNNWLLGDVRRLKSEKLIKIRVDGKNIQVWTREFQETILVQPSVFYKGSDGLYNANDDRTNATGKDILSFDFGRILGAMFLNGVRGVRFVDDFYKVLAGEIPANTVTFNQVAKGFWEVVPKEMKSLVTHQILSKTL